MDLDGVLVDFDAGIHKLFKKTADKVHPSTLWSTLARTRNFYSDLPWMSDGQLLWQSLIDAQSEPKILTGIPNGKWAESQKREWCKRELQMEGQRVITCKSKDKHRHGGKGAILNFVMIG